MKQSVFSKQSPMNAPVADVFNWHTRPGAIARLSPPWDPIQLLSMEGTLDAKALVRLKMHLGPFAYEWLAQHTRYEKNRLFADDQIKGPFRRWTHEHEFTELDGGDSLLTDRITFSLPLSPLSHPLFAAKIHKRLAAIFAYRHRITRNDLRSHRKYAHLPRLRVLISGASGLLGQSLIPFLTTGGHEVIRLTRQKPDASRSECFWDPYGNKLDLSHLGKIDAVIHLSGDNIGTANWTPQKKNTILKSRNATTALIAQTLSTLPEPPKIFLSASAIGYYGNRPDECLTEKSPQGRDFISRVCHEWESACSPAITAGIRTVFLRIGIVLSPEGGALSRLCLPFRLGLGARIGSGDQYMSWVSLDDVLYAIHQALFDERLEGPLNIVSPYPVTNGMFTRLLGRVLKRPTPFTLPASLIRFRFGQMGEELLLSTAHVLPEKLLTNGFQFSYPFLKDTLAHTLGIETT